jgi:hypothetical protein
LLCETQQNGLKPFGSRNKNETEKIKAIYQFPSKKNKGCSKNGCSKNRGKAVAAGCFAGASLSHCLP